MTGLLLALWVACGPGRPIAAADEALARGDLAAAEASYREALTRAPDDAEALYGLGWTLHLAGRAELARAAFQRCADLHPQRALGFKGLGSVAMGEGNVALARRRFEEALTRAPGDVPIRHSLALLALRADDPSEAVDAFRALVTEAPERAELHQGLAEALLRAERFEESLVAADAAVAKSGSPRGRALALVTRSRVLVRTSAGRVRAEDCAGTAPPVRAWLDAADRSLDEAEAGGVVVPELPEVRRSVRRQRLALEERCGASPASGAAVGAGG